MTDLSNNPDNLIPFFDLVASNQKAASEIFQRSMHYYVA